MYKRMIGVYTPISVSAPHHTPALLFKKYRRRRMLLSSIYYVVDLFMVGLTRPTNYLGSLCLSPPLVPVAIVASLVI